MTNDEALIENNLKFFTIRSFVNYLLDLTNVLHAFEKIVDFKMLHVSKKNDQNVITLFVTTYDY